MYKSQYEIQTFPAAARDVYETFRRRGFLNDTLHPTQDGTLWGEFGWYDWTGDMQRISHKHPDTVFLVKRQGEELGDTGWAVFARGAHVHRAGRYSPSRLPDALREIEILLVAQAASERPPQQSANIECAKLRETCQRYIDAIANKSYIDSDYKHYIFEAALEAVFGEDIWEWVRENS